LQLFDQLSQLLESATAKSRPALAEIELEVIALLQMKQSDLTAMQRVRIERGAAAALAAAGRHDEAVAASTELARRHPEDGTIQEEYAQLLLEGRDPASWRLALDQWRRVAAKSKPRSSRWFRAKYSIALAEIKLGDKAAAGKLIQYLQATEDLSQSGLQAEFVELLSRCRD